MPTIERVRRPFWIHQIVEYVIGLALISVSFQSPKPAVPALLGAAIILNAAIAIGPAGAFRLVPRRLHKYFDLVLMALLLVMSVQWWADVDFAGRLLLAAIAVVMGYIWFFTDFTEPAERKKAKAASRPTSEQVGRGAGRVVGGGVNAVRQMWAGRDQND